MNSVLPVPAVRDFLINNSEYFDVFFPFIFAFGLGGLVGVFVFHLSLKK